MFLNNYLYLITCIYYIIFQIICKECLYAISSGFRIPFNILQGVFCTQCTSYKIHYDYNKNTLYFDI